MLKFHSSYHQEGLPEDDEDDSVKEHDACEDSENGSRKLVSPINFIKNTDEESGSNIQPKKGNSQMHSPTIFPPMESPKTRSPYISSPKPEMHHKKESSTSMLRLLSTRAMDFTISSLPVTPQLHYDSSVSSEDSDGEMPVYFKTVIYSSV